MADHETIFERLSLYEQVWTTPISRLSKVYGLSDVGLRKICDKLRVPVPPLGHWTKVAHGKNPPRSALPALEGPATYVCRHQPGSERGASGGASDGLGQTCLPAELPAIALRDDPTSFHPVVRHMARGIRKPGPGYRGLVFSTPQESFRIKVAPASVKRALRILDGLWSTLDRAGARTVPGKDTWDPMTMTLDGESMGLAITELQRRGERELTREEKDKLKGNPQAYIYNRWDFEPRGVLKIVLLSAYGYPQREFRDGRKKLEEQLPNVFEAFRQYAQNQKLSREKAAEEARERAKREREYEARRAAVEKKLRRLRNAETYAGQHERAQRLRRYADALECSSNAQADSQEAAKGAQGLAELRHMANWLDPLVDVPWPGVDGEPAPDWWGDYQKSMGVVSRRGD